MTATYSENTMDLSILLNKHISNKCKDVTNCKSVQRVITALLYYQQLNKGNKNENSNGQSIFSQLLSEAFTHYLDDITHLMSRHESELENIHKLLLAQPHFVKCSIDECLMSDRHCEINDGKNGNIKANKNDLLSAFHEQTWDNIHFYLVHLFEVGLRQRESECFNEEKNSDTHTHTLSEDKWLCLDQRFKQQRTILETKRKRLPRFAGRFKPVSNKFIIQSMQQTQAQIKNDKTDDGMCIIHFIHK